MRSKKTKTAVMDYDPNIRWSTHVVRVTLGTWQYRARFEYEIEGNCVGFSVMEEAPQDVLELIAKNCGWDPDGDVSLESMEDLSFEMVGPDGSGLICEPNDDNLERWISDKIIAIEIIDKRPEGK